MVRGTIDSVGRPRPWSSALSAISTPRYLPWSGRKAFVTRWDASWRCPWVRASELGAILAGGAAFAAAVPWFNKLIEIIWGWG